MVNAYIVLGAVSLAVAVETGGLVAVKAVPAAGVPAEGVAEPQAVRAAPPTVAAAKTRRAVRRESVWVLLPTSRVCTDIALPIPHGYSGRDALVRTTALLDAAGTAPPERSYVRTKVPSLALPTLPAVTWVCIAPHPSDGTVPSPRFPGEELITVLAIGVGWAVARLRLRLVCRCASGSASVSRSWPRRPNCARAMRAAPPLGSVCESGTYMQCVGVLRGVGRAQRSRRACGQMSRSLRLTGCRGGQQKFDLWPQTRCRRFPLPRRSPLLGPTPDAVRPSGTSCGTRRTVLTVRTQSLRSGGPRRFRFANSVGESRCLWGFPPSSFGPAYFTDSTKRRGLMLALQGLRWRRPDRS